MYIVIVGVSGGGPGPPTSPAHASPAETVNWSRDMGPCIAVRLLLLSILDSTIVQKSLARVAENVNLGISGVYFS